MGGGGDKAPSVYQPTGQQGADQQFQSMSGQTSGWASALPSTVGPQYGAVLGNVMNDPNAAGAMATANQVSQAGQGIAQNDFGMASSLTGAGNSGLAAAMQALQMGFDPQSDLYNRTSQQVSDSANATNAMYGLSSSPYGAGVANQSQSNFNIDWQNQQLSRALQALQGYDNATGAAGQAFGQAGSLGGQGLQTMTSSGMLPYQTSSGIQNNQLAALGQYTQGMVGAMQPGFQQENQDLSYLGVGQNASQAALARWKAQNAQDQSTAQGIGNMAGDAIQVAAMFM